jgi:hypothetical protein
MSSPGLSATGGCVGRTTPPACSAVTANAATDAAYTPQVHVEAIRDTLFEAGASPP